jgi:hypothetical protein
MNHNHAKIIKIRAKGGGDSNVVILWIYKKNKSLRSHLKLIIGTRPHNQNSHIHVRYMCINFERISLKR